MHFVAHFSLVCILLHCGWHSKYVISSYFIIKRVSNFLVNMAGSTHFRPFSLKLHRTRAGVVRQSGMHLDSCA